MKTNTGYKTLAVYGSQNETMEIKFNEGGDKKTPVNILGYVYMYFSGNLGDLINVEHQAKTNDSTFTTAVLSDVGE